MLVGKALGLDVARIIEIALDEAFASAKSGNGLADC